MTEKISHAIDKANEYNLKLGKNIVLTSEQTECLNVFDSLSKDSPLVCSFYEDKIKAKFYANNIEYIADFFFEDGSVLIGSYDNKVYKVEEWTKENVNTNFKKLLELK